MDVLPQSIFRSSVSAGEKRVPKRVAGLDREGKVIHSLNLARHEDKRWGEADFVVAARCRPMAKV